MKLLFIIAVIFLCTFKENDAVQTRCCSTPKMCYTNAPPNQLMLLPQCADDLGMNLQVYTKRNPNVGQPITNTSIPSVYKGSVDTVYLVHGWDDSENATWLADMKNALLKKGDYNVIIVGWAKGAGNLDYLQASSNTRTAGAWLALVSNFTISHGRSSRKRQYCVGYNLGAYVCGQAGSVGQFGRISGLDPNGHANQIGQTSVANISVGDLSVGLNPSCADLVDVIHIFAGVAGDSQQLGHIDFYANGGLVQPGFDVPPINGVSLPYNIIYAYDLFTESVGTPCFEARKNCTNVNTIPLSCSSYGNKVLQNMGFEANKFPNRGLFYLTINASPPYCQG